MKYVLASASPRRIELMTGICENFIIAPANVDEDENKLFSAEELRGLLSYSPEVISMKLAQIKALKTAEEYPNDVVIGADTGVFLEGEMLGKAVDEEDAKRLLKKLSGKAHHVITGYAIIVNGSVYQGFENTKVVFDELSEELIADYIASDLWRGKAGAYGIQDGYPLVKEYEGDLNNVIGFPLESIKNKLEEVLKNGNC